MPTTPFVAVSHALQAVTNAVLAEVGIPLGTCTRVIQSSLFFFGGGGEGTNTSLGD